MSVAVSNPQVVVNNIPVAIVPNSVVFTEGLGEQTVRAASAGGASVEQVYAQNVETNFAMVKFELYPDPETVDLARAWKANRNENVVSVTGLVNDRGVEKTLRRTFNNASITNNYEVSLGADTTFEIEFMSDQSV